MGGEIKLKKLTPTRWDKGFDKNGNDENANANVYTYTHKQILLLIYEKGYIIKIMPWNHPKYTFFS